MAVIAATLGTTVQDARTAHPSVRLPQGGRVEVEIPEFGEAPPLAIDVYDPRGAAEARASAQSLLELLADATPWSLHHLLDEAGRLRGGSARPAETPCVRTGYSRSVEP
ncbi:hypothetical protein [Cryobacterium sp.]|uniref:hypothetical protein n=1 Tax=Cryobacterium sp. TaxID=1926290 RepID=UPI00262F7456|nr:hypothetical protein [Cryobacterium sp.]MCU1444389.1 hypothetical protein [Cryobacterium sp.]